MQIFAELRRQLRLLPSAQGGLYIDCKVWNALDHKLDHSPKVTSLSDGGLNATILQAEGPSSGVQQTATHLSNNPKQSRIS